MPRFRGNARKNQRWRKRLRQEAANDRHQQREKRTSKQQLALLDRRLGKGQGASKERSRLQKEIKNNN